MQTFDRASLRRGRSHAGLFQYWQTEASRCRSAGEAARFRAFP